MSSLSIDSAADSCTASPTTEKSPMRKTRSKSYLVKVHFGQPLDEIPEFIIQAMDFLIANATDVEGLFRMSGNSSDISYLKKHLNSGGCVELSEIENIHNLASLIKMYFRELPDPLMTYECYDMFIIADSIPDNFARLECIKKLLAYIPPSNLLVLRQLCLFLHELSLHSNVNRMTAENLAIVFSPNILRAPETKDDKLIQSHPFLEELSPLTHGEILRGYHAAQGVLQSVIENVEYFFKSDTTSFQEWKAKQETTHDSDSSATTVEQTGIVGNSPSLSEQISGTSVEEVTHNLKKISDRYTRSTIDEREDNLQYL